ncbi:MAG: flagellar biosynthesis protein FlhF [Lachnospiraceae bacterium]|nr:flagellar biosynthesis protein FlhF [Lachnospiraceae bacterium]
MIIKKFRAATETEAIMQAKEELGKDAIVMNIKKFEPRGLHKLFKKPSVEITAAVDDSESYDDLDKSDRIVSEVQKLKEQEANAARHNAQNAQATQAKREANKDIILDESIDDKKKETEIEERLNNLQKLLEKQIIEKEKEKADDEEKSEEKGVQENSKKIACMQLIYNQMIDNEVDEKYANQLINEVEKNLNKDASVDTVLSGVYQKIVLKLGQPDTIKTEEGEPKFIFFIGPTGVGKTTTIAKIASSLNLKKKQKVALITSDTYRIAAVEQLRTYAGILGVPLKVVYNADEMKASYSEFESSDIVLIDTAGGSHNNEERQTDIAELIKAIPKEQRKVYLVLSTTTKYKDLIKITEKYSQISDYNLIFTKLDETSCIGNIYNIHMLTNAPLSYATWGQNVPDDIGRIDAQRIAKQLLGGND